MPVYSAIAHDQADPGTFDRRVAQVDIFPNQPLRALAFRIDQSLARAGIPVEQQIDAFCGNSRFGAALLPFIRSIARYGGVRAAIPAARPMAFDRVVLAAAVRGA